MCRVTTKFTSYAPLMHLFPLPCTAVSIGAPETEPWWLGFGLLAQKPTSATCATKCVTSPPNLPHTHVPSTSSHCPALSFPLVHLKPSPSGSVFTFSAPTLLKFLNFSSFS